MKAIYPPKTARIVELKSPLFKEKEIKISVLREDENHPEIQGNKFRKLYYNLLNARKKGSKTLLTFGGAFSNHLVATAHAGHEFGFKTIGMVRGEEHLPLNSTLAKCKELGMELFYVDRSIYRIKHTQDYKEYLRERFENFYLIPEGGTNFYAVNGCMEIVADYSQYDYICCPVGTGGTIAGIVLANNKVSTILGFPALKGGEFLVDEISAHINSVVNDTEITDEFMKSLTLHCEYHFGGYGKINKELISFVQNFYKNHQFKWDLLYNGKMAFGVYQMIEKNYFPKGSKVLLIHTGGIQGIEGIEKRVKSKIYED